MLKYCHSTNWNEPPLTNLQPSAAVDTRQIWYKYEDLLSQLQAKFTRNQSLTDQIDFDLCCQGQSLLSLVCRFLQWLGLMSVDLPREYWISEWHHSSVNIFAVRLDVHLIERWQNMKIQSRFWGWNLPIERHCDHFLSPGDCWNKHETKVNDRVDRLADLWVCYYI